MNGQSAYHPFSEFDLHFQDPTQLAAFMLLSENDTPGFVAFRAFRGEGATPEEWEALSRVVIHDLDCPALTIFIYGLQIIATIADYLRDTP